ncbi:MAG: hypothetical protein ABSH49_30215 [Bryobacteraceae bacterium]|jgi:Tfp pilus assembly protein PilX/uncharacterized membrane protein (DUF485 family)
MEDSEKHNELRRELVSRWREFFVALLDPWTIILLVSTVAFVAMAAAQKNSMLTAILSSAGSVCAGLFSAIITKKWQERIETELLEARARSAIRNLKLLLGTVVALERRVNAYLENISTSDCPQSLVETYLEEIVEKCNTLHEETINAIENWTDIIPEANVTTQIGKIGALQAQIADLAGEANRLRSELGTWDRRSISGFRCRRLGVRAPATASRASTMEIEDTYGATPVRCRH